MRVRSTLPTLLSPGEEVGVSEVPASLLVLIWSSRLAFLCPILSYSCLQQLTYVFRSAYVRHVRASP